MPKGGTLRKVARIVAPLMLAGLLGASLAVPSTALSDDTSILDSEKREHMHSFWDANDVPRSTQDRLIDGIENGVWPLADRGDVEPVRTATRHRHGNVETVDVFADGSIAVAAVQQEEGSFNPQSFGVDTVKELKDVYGAAPSASIDNCRTSSGSGYVTRTDCTVFGSTATVGAGFLASYQIVQGKNNDRILRHSGPFQQCGGAVCGTPYLAIEYLNEQSGRNAQVTYFFRWTIPGASSTGRIGLIVGRDTAYPDWKAKI